MRLLLKVRRFYCLSPDCSQQTFAEQFPDWLPAYARRTNRLTQLMYRVALDLGGEASRRILSYISVRVSGDTLLRILRKHHYVADAALRTIGVDDWAMKKGRTYGTIIVNLETHQVVELLPDRTADTLTQWLQAHPSIELVTRDRSTDYAAGIKRGAPQALQVADRWHLLLNLRQMLERYLTTVYSTLQQLPISSAYQTLLQKNRDPFMRTQGEILASNASRDQRLALYNQIRQMRQAGWNISQLAQQLHHHPATIRKYYYATNFPERKPRRTAKNILDPYLPYLKLRLEQGCENALQLWREIQTQGYPGSHRQVMKWMHVNRTSVASHTPVSHRNPTQLQLIRSTLPSSKQLAWLLVRDPASLTDDDQILLDHLQQNTQILTVYAFCHRFVTMVKNRFVDEFDPWITDSETVAVVQVQNFVLGLQSDYSAVRAALANSWSNGQTEGQVNRLKFIKRQMYGRAKFDLLRLRVLAPP
jgi:transposase